MDDVGSRVEPEFDVVRRISELGVDCCELNDMLLILEENLMCAEEKQHAITKFGNDTQNINDEAFSSFAKQQWNDLEKHSQQLTQNAGVAAEAAISLRSSLFSTREVLSLLRAADSVTEEFYWNQMEVIRQHSVAYLTHFKRIEIVLQHLRDVQTVYLETQKNCQQNNSLEMSFDFQDGERQLNNLQYRRDRLKRCSEELLKEMDNMEREEQRVGRLMQRLHLCLQKLKATREVVTNENHPNMTPMDIQISINKVQDKMKYEVEVMCSKKEMLRRRYAWQAFEANDCSSEHKRLAGFLQSHLEHTRNQIQKLRGEAQSIDSASAGIQLESNSSFMKNFEKEPLSNKERISKQSERICNILNLIRKMIITPQAEIKEDIEVHLNDLINCEELNDKQLPLIDDVCNVEDQTEQTNADCASRFAIQRLHHLVKIIKGHVSNFYLSRTSQELKDEDKQHGEMSTKSLRKNVTELQSSCNDLKSKLEAAKETYKLLVKKLKKFEETQ